MADLQGKRYTPHKTQNADLLQLCVKINNILAVKERIKKTITLIGLKYGKTKANQPFEKVGRKRYPEIGFYKNVKKITEK